MNLMEVSITRGEQVESRHKVLVAFSDQKAMTPGNELELVFPRSSIKPLQALLLVETGAMQAFGLDTRHLALAAASHKCESQHLNLVREWLAKLNLTENDLVCAGHWPGHLASAHEMIRRGEKPTPAVNNCSGKHTGLLTVCRHLKFSTAGYQEWHHPLQQLLRKRLSELTEFDFENAPWGIDGCGIPTFAIPLWALAKGMSYLASQEPAAKAVVAAMQAHPQLVGGSEDFTSKMIAATEGRALVKTGAEGVFAGVFLEKKIGFAVKAIDGAARAAEATTAFLLKEQGALSQSAYQELRDYTFPAIKNWKGEGVGRTEVLAHSSRLC